MGCQKVVMCKSGWVGKNKNVLDEACRGEARGCDEDDVNDGVLAMV